MLLNVVKHSGVRRARVEMALDAGGSELRVAVLDEGSGFDEASVGREVHAGTGLGLLSIRERLGLLSGRLEVESSPGRGASFVMVVPLKPGAVRENESTGKPTV